MKKVLIPALILVVLFFVGIYIRGENLTNKKEQQDGTVFEIGTTTDIGVGEIKNTEVKFENKSNKNNFESYNSKAKKYKKYVELVNPDGYLNIPSADKITIGELIGKKVIMVDFWTYSCINCQRTLPYLNAWYEKYAKEGFEIIAVHTPEFGFEKIKENVLSAISKYNIKYPVVQDNQYQTWSAYQNQYWPRKYLIDIDGFIVYDHIGEGAYLETENKIRELLEEKMARAGMDAKIIESTASDKINSTADFSKISSPETYFGSLRNKNFGNGIMGKSGTQTLIEPSQSSIIKNLLYLSGDWNITPEYAENIDSGKIIFKYNAKSVYLVAGAENSAEIEIYRDGVLLTGVGAGADLKNGTVSIKENRLYKLIEDFGYGEHTLEIKVKSGTLQAFAFTFG